MKTIALLLNTLLLATFGLLPITASYAQSCTCTVTIKTTLPEAEEIKVAQYSSATLKLTIENKNIYDIKYLSGVPSKATIPPFELACTNNGIRGGGAIVDTNNNKTITLFVLLPGIQCQSGQNVVIDFSKDVNYL